MKESRDPALEQTFLDDVAELVRQFRGLAFNPADVDIYRRHIAERLRIGAERYGADAFLGRDNLVEVEPESADVAAYAILDLNRLKGLMAEDAWQEMRMHLVVAAAKAAEADVAVRAALRVREQASREVAA
jgi:glutathione S-transferase